MNIKNIAIELIEKVSKKDLHFSIDYSIDKDDESLWFWHRDERYRNNVEGLLFYNSQPEEYQRMLLQEAKKVIESNGEVLLND